MSLSYSIGEVPQFEANNIYAGSTRIVIGIAKKVIIADSMNLFITPFHNVYGATDRELIIAIYAYSLKIFF